MANLLATLANAVAGAGVQAGVDMATAPRITTMPFRNVTCNVIIAGASPDYATVVEFDASLDGVNYWSLGRKVGPGVFNNDQDTFQWLRVNIISQAAGSTCTVQAGAI